MTDGGGLINLGELSRPATVLIEKISDAIGAIFQPYQIKRLAKAEAEAEKIRAIAGIEISKVQQRAIIRMIQEEGKRQERIERISSLAIQDLKLDAKPEKIETDWLINFFEKGRLVADFEMQTLWGKILAGEANQPGSFSRRTIELVSYLDKEDAKIFTSLCKFVWHVREYVPIIVDETLEIYNKQGISFETLKHLDDLGLIAYDFHGGYILKGLSQEVTVHYFGKPVKIRFPKKKGNELETGKVIFTKAGRQLVSIAGAAESDEFFQFTLSEWKKTRILNRLFKW